MQSCHPRNCNQMGHKTPHTSYCQQPTSWIRMEAIKWDTASKCDDMKRLSALCTFLRENRGQVVSLAKWQWCGALVFSQPEQAVKTKSNNWWFETPPHLCGIIIMSWMRMSAISPQYGPQSIEICFIASRTDMWSFFIMNHQMILWNDLS